MVYGNIVIRYCIKHHYVQRLVWNEKRVENEIAVVTGRSCSRSSLQICLHEYQLVQLFEGLSTALNVGMALAPFIRDDPVFLGR